MELAKAKSGNKPDGTVTTSEEDQIPGLGYDLTRERKRAIATQMSFIVAINTIAPTCIFFLYKHLAGNYQRNPALTYTWVTLALGTIELFQWPYRTYLLCRRNYACSGRPLRKPSTGGDDGDEEDEEEEEEDDDDNVDNADHAVVVVEEEEAAALRGPPRRLHLIRSAFTRQDFFGTLFLLAIIIGAVMLTLCCSLGGTVGSFPLLVMSIPSIVLFLGLVLAGSSILTFYKYKIPIQVSSLSPHQTMRPAVYFIIEDIVAVDGQGGYAFRRRISSRYQASVPFQRLMQHLTIIFASWAFVLFLLSLGLVVANVKIGLNEDIVYAVVVAFSLLWSALIAVLAWQHSQKALRREKIWWQQKSSVHNRAAAAAADDINNVQVLQL